VSIVIGVRKAGKTWVAADTQSSFGATRVLGSNGTVSKLRRVGGAVIGTTGWGIYENILDDFLSEGKQPALATRGEIFTFFLRLWKALHERYPFVNDQSERDDSPFGNLDATFLVANREGLHHVASDISVTPFREYCAVGAGADFSMGAAYSLYSSELGAEVIARRACEAACAFNVYCGGEIELLDVK